MLSAGDADEEETNLMLRQRRPDGARDPEADGGSAAPRGARLLERAVPLCVGLGRALDAAAPKVAAAYARASGLWARVPRDARALALGLALCFFGGRYALLVCATEAFIAVGWPRVEAPLRQLQQAAGAVAEASAADDEVDADGDGVADVRQITSEQLATRKVLLTLRAVDPPKVAEAFGGVVAGGAAVLAAVRVRFAAAVALGHSVAQHAARPLAALLSPALTHALPLEYRKWVPVLVGGAAKLLAITCVWLIAAAQAAVQSALRGGMLASRSALRMLAAADRLPAPLLGAGGTWDEDASAVDEACGWALAAVGCYFQLAHGFAVPFPLSVCALPFDLAEFALRWLVVAAGDGASPLDATLADVPAS